MHVDILRIHRSALTEPGLRNLILVVIMRRHALFLVCLVGASSIVRGRIGSCLPAYLSSGFLLALATRGVHTEPSEAAYSNAMSEHPLADNCP